MKTRCAWCGTDPESIRYHDEVWGVPVHDDRTLFEFLVLEGAQAGLSWVTILKRQKKYRAAFDQFNLERIATYSACDIERLLAESGIIRNRLKIESVIKNAQGTLQIQEEFGSFDAFLWRYVDEMPIQNHWRSSAELPVQTKRSEQLSRDLKQRGFNFVGPTICYAYMQAVGMVNDHTTDCFRYHDVQESPNQRNGSTP